MAGRKGEALKVVPSQVWVEILRTLRSRVNEGTYRAWFARLVPTGIHGDVVYLGVPNHFFQRWMRQRYGALTAAVVSDALGRAVAVDFSISPELFVRARRAEARASVAATVAPTVRAWLDGIGWDGDREGLYAHGEVLLLEAAREYRESEREGAVIRRPSAYYAGIVDRLAGARAQVPARVTDELDQSRVPQDS